MRIAFLFIIVALLSPSTSHADDTAGLFVNENNAIRLRDKLIAEGRDAYIMVQTYRGRKYHAVMTRSGGRRPAGSGEETLHPGKQPEGMKTAPAHSVPSKPVIDGLRVFFITQDGRQEEMAFTGFNTSCEGYKDSGVKHTVDETTTDIPWGEIKYFLPVSGAGKLKNGREFRTNDLRPSSCKGAYVSEGRARKSRVDGHDKVVTEEVRYGIKEMKLIAFSSEWLEEGISDIKGMIAGEMVFVEGGCYQMGCGIGMSDCDSDESPVFDVCVDDFYIGQYEVTQEHWREVLGGNPSYFSNCDDCPVEMVSWDDVQEFIGKLNAGTGGNYRLPTEAEWEYAARSGGRRENYAGTSRSPGDYAWYMENSGWKSHPVGRKRPNGLGLYDMSGNVWEWCSDRYGMKYYERSPTENPQGPLSGGHRVLRGGSWRSKPGDVRTTNRDWNRPVNRNFHWGFRLAGTP
jgi:formylglycine-generating enzyme required for sulfatase activity